MAPPLVLVAPVVPGRTGYGLRMRAGLLLEALSRWGPVHVVVIPVVSQTAGGSGTQFTVVELDPEPDGRADLSARLADPALRQQATELHPRPSLCTRATLAAAEAVAELVSGARLVVVTRLYLAPFLDTVLGGDHRPTLVLDVDDVESTTRRDMGDAEEAERYDRLERHYLPRFDRVFVSSADDADELRARVGVAADVVPNAVALPERGRAERPVEHDLVFVANFSYAPNVEGAAWLCREILPRLDSVSVALVGRDPAARVTALAEPGRVLVSGTVDDVSPFYAASRVAVVPLLTGGGTSIKFIEALAHGKPVVATPAGARGWPVTHDEHALLADRPDAFAAACRAVLTDQRLAARLAQAGRSLVEREFTSDVVASRVADLLGQ